MQGTPLLQEAMKTWLKQFGPTCWASMHSGLLPLTHLARLDVGTLASVGKQRKGVNIYRTPSLMSSLAVVGRWKRHAGSAERGFGKAFGDPLGACRGEVNVWGWRPWCDSSPTRITTDGTASQVTACSAKCDPPSKYLVTAV
jgi:hypothetical protein